MPANCEKRPFCDQNGRSLLRVTPILLYVGKRETELIIPHAGYELSSRYLLYRFQVEGGQPEEAIGIDAPPPKGRFDVVRVDQ